MFPLFWLDRAYFIKTDHPEDYLEVSDIVCKLLQFQNNDIILPSSLMLYLN